jgi:hypothetical protein
MGDPSLCTFIRPLMVGGWGLGWYISIGDLEVSVISNS